MRRMLLAVIVLAGMSLARPLDKVRKDALTVGVRAVNSPFGLIENGENRGLEYDIISAIAEGLGIRFRIIKLDSQRDGEDKLQVDKIDLVIGSVKSAKELQDRFFLSNPYYRSSQGILVAKSNQSIFTMSDLNGRYVATTPESGADRLIESFIPKAKVEMVRTVSDAFDLLQKGDVDAVVHDKAVLQLEQARNSAVRVLDLSLTEDNLVIVANKRSGSLMDAVNSEIDRLRTSPSAEAYSPLGALYAKYKLPNTIKPILKSGAPAARTPVGAAPPPVPSASAASTSAPRSSGDVEARIDAIIQQVRQLDSQLQELKRSLR